MPDPQCFCVHCGRGLLYVLWQGMNTRTLFHITTEEEAGDARRKGSYVSQTFEREGFIHCSYAHQVAATASRIFRGRRNLVLLQIDPEKVGCRIVEENLEGGNELYPHIYGHLPMSAVEHIRAFPCDDAGLFTFNG